MFARLFGMHVVSSFVLWAPQTVRETPAPQAAATEAWLEGLARRYGRGVHPTLAHMQSTGNVTLPWSLGKAPVVSQAGERLEEERLEHDLQEQRKPVREL